MATVPGAFPATPDVEPQAEPVYEQPQYQAQPQRHDRHHHHNQHAHQRNKLHKANDPRGHRYTDSGVGIGDSDPLPPQSDGPAYSHSLNDQDGGIDRHDDDNNNRHGYDDTSYTIEPQLKSTARQSNDGAYDMTSSQPTDNIAQDKSAVADDAVDKSAVTAVGRGPEDEEVTERKAHNATPPYWGSLPKASGGGIYNTVIGHGSPKDDHLQHHHMAQRGGVYNSVAGHGSQDEESQRHESFYPIEQQTMSSYPTETSERPAGVTGYPVEVPMLPSDTSKDPISAPDASGGLVGTSKGPVDASGGRAFPLSSHRDDGRRGKEKEGLLAGVAGVGVASELATKPNKITKQKEPSTTDEDSRRTKDDSASKEGGFISGSLPFRHKDDREEKHEKHVEKKESRKDRSPSDDKKHKIFGIFHRRKGSNDDHKPREERANSAPFPQQTEDRGRQRRMSESAGGALHPMLADEQPDMGTSSHASSRHKNSKERSRSKRLSANQTAAATVAESAGGFGIMHQQPIDEDVGKKNEGSSHGSSRRKSKEHSRDRSRQLSAGQSAAAAVAESGGAFGVLYQKPEENEETDNLHVTHSGTKIPPELASHSPMGRSSSPKEDANQPWDQRQSISQIRNTNPVAAGSAMAAGLGAYHLASDRDPSPRAYGSDNPEMELSRTQAALGVFENPREPPAAPAIAGSQSKKHNTRAPSPTNKGPVRQSVPSSDAGEYNVLPSGTISGVKTGPQADSREQPQASRDYPHGGTSADESASKDMDDSGTYNVLASGTPSGVKIQPRDSSRSRSKSRSRRYESRQGDFAQEGDGKHEHFKSGTPSGVHVSHHHKEPARERQGYAQETGDAARDTLVAAPMPSRHNERAAVREEAEKMAHNVSPEVLPEAYTTPAPRSTLLPTADDNAPPVPGSWNQPRHKDAESSHPAAWNPALAAATGAWASKAGPSSGTASRGAVIHKCEHCGRDNDITSYFSR